MSADRYLTELRGLADELLEAVPYEFRDVALELLQAQYPQSHIDLPEKRKTAALRLLAASPSKARQQFECLDSDGQMRLWCDARFLALMAVRAMELTMQVTDRLHGSYRKAQAAIADEGHRAELWPTAWQIAHERLI